MTEPVLFVELGIDATNQDILDQMQIMKRGRESGFYKNVVCTVRGFDGDKRELFDIIEVRAFCRRLVTLGFISYLDLSALLSQETTEITKYSWGAVEVWLCSENRLKAEVHLTSALLEEIKQALSDSNIRAEAALGPMS